jgi:hypothetical protein
VVTAFESKARRFAPTYRGAFATGLTASLGLRGPSILAGAKTLPPADGAKLATNRMAKAK